MTDQESHTTRLAEIARSLQGGDTPPSTTVRSFLSWFFGSQRRGHWIVSYIRRALHQAGLRTDPDFESAYLDAPMRFVLIDLATDTPDEVLRVEVADTITVSDHAQIQIVSTAFGDPTFRVSKLAAANRTPVSLQPDSTITEAVTLMMANDFSQLPVISGERNVKGVVSWRSIGSRLALGQRPVAARDAMETHAEVSADASLFAAIPVIVEHQYVLVRGSDQRIIGIVTTSDLSLQFRQLAEPFLLLGEVENHLRRIISARFGTAELAEAQDPNDAARTIETAADLTFGEYKRFLEDPERWSRLAVQIDRNAFIGLLEKVREIRNDVMHFDPDGIPDGDLEILRDFARFLRTLQALGAT
jgi:predicted transcriptional regulator